GSRRGPAGTRNADAVVMAWYPGCEGGHAVADILFGAEAPSGRLPQTFAKATADMPAFNDYNMKGRTYRFADKEPLYPFGFGLSFGQVSYDSISLDKAELCEKCSVTAKAVVTNRSAIALKEVVQCYVVPPQTWPDAPKSQLVGFEKIDLAPGASATVTFTLPAASFMQYDAAGRKVLPKGSYGVVIGSCSPGKRGLELGAASPVEAVVTVG
ncbi:MAG TPA: glycoside hydrolase family 3 C-terminal domain-containing protein, partial [Opitutales bacterium]|nr:glycoside hydrolase family 3 C-terminal domain-containing protein [Opitutales bacterium]